MNDTANGRAAVKRRTWVIAGLVTVAAVAVVAGIMVAVGQEPVAEQAVTSSPTPTPKTTPLTAAEQLLAGADDPAACAVTFVADGVEVAPMLQTTGILYQGLPVPEREGDVFAGWYSSTDAAAALDATARVNGADLVTCAGQQATLYGAWMTGDAAAAEDVEVPILMYHQFTTLPEGEDNWLRLNYAYIGDFEQHIRYISEQQFYLPTWDELEAFIDGRLYLPQRSVIVTDDDADQTWFDLAVPIVDEYGVLSTSFMITAYRQDPAPSPYVLRRSHTHDMHQAGDNGEGRMVNWSPEEIAADLTTSAETLGVGEVVAYPFGHHDQRSKDGVALAGFTMARTIEPGYVRPGTDKFALPVVRIDYGMNLDDLISAIG